MAKILVVDDSKFMRMVLRNILQKDGRHQVVGEAEDVPSAVDRYKELKPDLVTLDIIMPGEEGLEALRQILESDPSAKVTVVSVMLGQEQLIEEARRFGAKGFVTSNSHSRKPPEPPFRTPNGRISSRSCMEKSSRRLARLLVVRSWKSASSKSFVSISSLMSRKYRCSPFPKKAW